MTNKTIAEVIFRYSNGGNAKTLPYWKQEKLKNFWVRLQSKVGADIFHEIIEEIRSLKEKNYESKALLFAEKYGIIDYTIDFDKMIYERNYDNEGRFIHTVNLDTNKETILSEKEISEIYKGL
jgi:DNA-binding sugar fermentation-stimulating protein